MRLNLDPPPGFGGLRDDLPVTFYRRHLPHWRQERATYFTTFRLGDSLPASAIADFESIRKEWETRHHPEPLNPQQTTDLAIELSRRAEHWLDQGHGSCLFKNPDHRTIIENAMRFFDTSAPSPRYELGAYVVMPNHVHCLIRPLSAEEFPLETLEGSWKRFVSREINRLQGTSGSIWFQESYDRIVRDAEHLYRCLQYIGRNPLKANLREGEFARWVSPTWEEFGWRFRAR
ncbi:MAG: hypothetical protein KDN20_01310 [Verrucomicrobiae bacterium]|nr:hypothetical protein [Verrucomicrobiae bacterium]